MTINRELAIRSLALYAPAALLALRCAVQGVPRRRAVAAFVASAWSFTALLGVNVLAPHMGWWTFAPSRPAIAQVPLDVLVGWTMLWGAAPVLWLTRAPVTLIALLLGALDLLFMPLATPVVRLGDTWLVGEAVALLAALVPAQLLARWTEDDRHVERRAAMQAMVFIPLTGVVLPTVIFEHATGSWAPLLTNWNRFGGAHLQLALLPAVLGLSAVQEFATRGKGTPLPFDPPRRLVTSGPYAYVANPMQLSLALFLVAWGGVLQNIWVAAAGVMAVIYGAGLAASDESGDLRTRFGDSWVSYRRHVANWVPRWRPYHPIPANAGSDGGARLYVAATCDKCAEVARWFHARQPVALSVVPAELHPRRQLARVTYDPGDGSAEDDGVAAIARALEHVNLGWAFAGWVIRLPGWRQAIQFLVDASGGEARAIPRAELPGHVHCHVAWHATDEIDEKVRQKIREGQAWRARKAG